MPVETLPPQFDAELHGVKLCQKNTFLEIKPLPDPSTTLRRHRSYPCLLDDINPWSPLAMTAQVADEVVASTTVSVTSSMTLKVSDPEWAVDDDTDSPIPDQDAPNPPDCASAIQSQSEARPWKTTVMLRNIPNDYTRNRLCAVLDAGGFHGKYDFVYLPIDFGSKSGFGYAFINLVTPSEAIAFFTKFQGFSAWTIPSRKVAEVTWSEPHQGLDMHIERYRSSPVMHAAVPDEYKPAMFRGGVRVPFSPPSKSLRPPRVRPSKRTNGSCDAFATKNSASKQRSNQASASRR